MYQLIKKILFTLDPEKAHYLSLNCLRLAYQLGLTKILTQGPTDIHHVMGLSFKNPIGLAAGYDKNGDYIDALATLGFGFIEIGTITPKPQIGNIKPRIFRLVEQEAIINRMGFPNKGLAYSLEALKKIKYQGVLGINIGKNKDTPNSKAADDYLLGFSELAKFASYVVINISSPNTEGLRDLQQKDSLSVLLSELKAEQKRLVTAIKKYVPLVVKISPDMNKQELHDLATALLEHQIDGVIATNTTLSRVGVENSVYGGEKGGLSGKPLQARSLSVIKELNAILENKIPIIACGGVMDEESARDTFDAGAKLIQVYTGLVYQGPDLIKILATVR